MSQEKGSISIHAQNIMPIIKRWLYSDKDIFVRELVSNGCDAITKMKLIAATTQGTTGDEPYRIDITLDEPQRTITIADNGVGMTAEEVRKYITQVAFSGAEDFMKQYKPGENEDSTGIIGHFGLGFYSAFMVSSKVTIDTLSYEAGAQPVRWESEDGMEYEMSESDRAQRGTAITLTLSEEEGEFLSEFKLREVLGKYCAFMNVPIYLHNAAKPEDKAEGDSADQEHDDHDHAHDHDHDHGHDHDHAHDHDQDHDHAEAEFDADADAEGDAAQAPAETPVNDTHPLWLRKPSEVTDEEYRAFYTKVFNDYEPPLFWIHLNAEYPFNLKGILYFPKLRQDFGVNEGQIKLYSGQVFVADNIKEVIPEFLMLLKGVIDCPELPLNVSRSFLQNDGYVKKLSAYITRKVADRLVSEFTGKREDYQKYWDDIHPFVKYGCIRDEKFYERVKDALLLKTVDGEYLTLQEYEGKAPEGKGKTVYYTNDAKRQAQMVELWKDQGVTVVVLDTLIDGNFISFLEYSQKEGLSFKRVDAALEGVAEDAPADDARAEKLIALFKKAVGDEKLEVKLQTLKSDELPAMMTVDEQSRRFAEMSRQWGGGGFSMPEQKTLVLSSAHPLINYLAGAEEGEDTEALAREAADLAELARGPLEPEQMLAFVRRTGKLMTMLAEKLGQ